MPVFLHSLILSIACGLLFGCADLPLPPEVAFAPQTPPSSMPPDPQAEPKVWGVLSRLVGRKFDPPQSGFPGFEFVWSKPGQEMQEIFAYHHGESFGDPERHRRTIRPGALPGQLVATFDSLSFVGTVEADGSVYFKGQDIYGYRFRLNSKGELLFENVGMTPEGKLNAVYFSTPYPVVGSSTISSATTPTSQPQATSLESTQQTAAGQPVLTANNAIKTPAEVLSSHTAQPTVGGQTVTKAAAPHSGNWGVLEKLIGKTWQMGQTGGYLGFPKLLRYELAPDGHTVVLSTGDGYSSTRVGDFQIDPATGGITVSETNEDGVKVRVPVTVSSNGEIAFQSSPKKRYFTSIDSAGILVNTQQELGWLGDWSTTATGRYFDTSMGPEWGIFTQLIGFNWSRNEIKDLYFEWFPSEKLVRMRVAAPYDNPGNFIDFTLRPDHPGQVMLQGSQRDQFFGGPAGLMVLDGKNKAVRPTSEARFNYELTSSPDRLIVSWETVVDGKVKEHEGVFVRESKTQKDERIAYTLRVYEKRRESARTTAFIQSMEQLNGVLTSANQMASANEAESRAELNETLSDLSAMAALEQKNQINKSHQRPETNEAAGSSGKTEAVDIGSSNLESEQDATVAAALAQARKLANDVGADAKTIAQLDLAQQEMDKRNAANAKGKQQAGANKIYATKITLNTATNSMVPSPTAPEPDRSESNMAAGKVRLCNRPGDEGPAHWPMCPDKTKLVKESGGTLVSNSSKGSDRAEKTDYTSKPDESSDPTDDGRTWSKEPATAWCMLSQYGNFKCWGPSGGKALHGTKTIQEALSNAACTKGEGRTPSIGEMNLFDCGRLRHATDSKVPANRPAPW